MSAYYAVCSKCGNTNEAECQNCGNHNIRETDRGFIDNILESSEYHCANCNLYFSCIACKYCKCALPSKFFFNPRYLPKDAPEFPPLKGALIGGMFLWGIGLLIVDSVFDSLYADGVFTAIIALLIINGIKEKRYKKKDTQKSISSV
jgi:hypothetical protein